MKPLVRLRAPVLAAALALPLAAGAQTAKWDLATAYADSEFQTRNVRLFARTVMPQLQKFDAGAPIDRSTMLVDHRLAVAAE